MDKEFDEKIKKMVKSMYKTVQNMKQKDAISDVLDKDKIAQMSPDSIPSGKTGALNKNKEKMKKDMKKFLALGGTQTSGQNPTSSTSQGKPPPPAPGTSIADQIGFGKNEIFVKDMMKNFEKISKAYLEKMNKKEK